MPRGAPSGRAACKQLTVQHDGRPPHHAGDRIMRRGGREGQAVGGERERGEGGGG